MVKVKLFNQIFFQIVCILGRPPRPKLYGFAYRAQGQHPQGYGEGSFFRNTTCLNFVQIQYNVDTMKVSGCKIVIRGKGSVKEGKVQV